MNHLNNPKNWNVLDPFPGKKLYHITPYSSRARALYARKKNKISDGHLNIVGAIGMLEGLEYHYQNYIKIHKSIKHAKKSWEKDKALKHEIVAYLNRLYQFYKFYDSRFVKGKLNGKAKIRHIRDNLMPLRHNYAGHRKLDMEKMQSSEALNLEMLFSAGSQRSIQKNELILVFKNYKKETVTLNLINDHPKVARESYLLISQLLR